MKINKQKTRNIIIEQPSNQRKIQIGDETLQQVHKSTYLGVVINKNKGAVEDKINKRIAKTQSL